MKKIYYAGRYRLGFIQWLELVTLIVLSCFFLVWGQQSNRLVPVRVAINTMISPIEYAINLPFELIELTDQYLRDRNQLVDEIAQYKKDIKVYRSNDIAYQSIADENTRLRKVLKAIPDKVTHYMLAEVMRVYKNPQRQVVKVNRGTSDGVYIGQVVIDGNAIYGQVIEVGYSTAQIMQITDTRHAMSVINVRTGVEAVAVGNGKDDTLNLKYIETKTDIKKDDLYVSTGLGEIFPEDFHVGRVTEVRYNPGDSLLKVTADTIADVEGSRELLLIWKENKHDEANKAAINAPMIEGVTLDDVNLGDGNKGVK